MRCRGGGETRAPGVDYDVIAMLPAGADVAAAQRRATDVMRDIMAQGVPASRVHLGLRTEQAGAQQGKFVVYVPVKVVGLNRGFIRMGSSGCGRSTGYRSRREIRRRDASVPSFRTAVRLWSTSRGRAAIAALLRYASRRNDFRLLPPTRRQRGAGVVVERLPGHGRPPGGDRGRLCGRPGDGRWCRRNAQYQRHQPGARRAREGTR